MALVDFEPRRGYYSEDSKIPLPDLDFAGQTLIAAVVLFIIGWLISQSSKQPNGEKGSTMGGCIMVIGICCAFPAFTWISSIGNFIYLLIIIVIAIVAIISFLFKK